MQTCDVCIISLSGVQGLCLAFSDVNILQCGVEVSGIKLVPLLHGWVTENGIEVVFVPSVPCQCNNFNHMFSMRVDVSYTLWQDVVQSVIALFTSSHDMPCLKVMNFSLKSLLPLQWIHATC